MPARTHPALLRQRIHFNKAEAQVPTLRPFEVVGQRPVIVTLHRNAVPNRLPDLPEVIDDKGGAVPVMRVGNAVFRDVDRFAVTGGLEEQSIEPLRVNLTVAEVADLRAG